jgi:hypothetical protein
MNVSHSMTESLRHRGLAGVVSVLALALLVPALAAGQELEPRRYVNVPTGVNFAAVVYGYSTGNVLLDPSLPIEGADSKLHAFALRYVRSFGFFGQNARLRAFIPASFGDWEGTFQGAAAERRVDGFGDLRVGVDVNFVGAPALRRSEFGTARNGTVVGASLEVGVPVGQFDRDRLINLSNHRWILIPQLGMSHTIGRWTVEAAGRVWLFGVNDDFSGGNRLEQRPLATLQVHGVYTIRPGFWLGGSVGVANGGRTVVNGSARDTYQQNTRASLTLAYPITPALGLRLAAGTNLTTTSGADYTTLGIGLQYGWGGR